MNDVRKPSAAGTFYSGSTTELEGDISFLFSSVRQISFPNTNVFIAPHAGYIYSGLTAAHVYANLQQDKFKSVIIISPSHYEYFNGISIYPGSAYRTPFGEIPIDREKAFFLTENSEHISFAVQGHGKEHGVEVHLPFLQKVNSSFSFVPIVIGAQDTGLIDELAKKLAPLVDDENCLLIASSDLSHFYTKRIANQLDGLLVERIKNFDYDNLQNDVLTGACEACGAAPILALMKALSEKQKAKPAILHRSDSSDVTGDISSVVGYLAAALN